MAPIFKPYQHVQCGRCREDGEVVGVANDVSSVPNTYEIVVRHSSGVEHRLLDEDVEASILLPGNGPWCRSTHGTTARCTETGRHELHRGRNPKSGQLVTWASNGTETTG